MPDRYLTLVNAPVGRALATRVGLPRPPRLRRHRPGDPVVDGEVLLGAPGTARLVSAIAETLVRVGADVATPLDGPVRTAAAQANLDAKIFNPEAASRDRRFRALVLDATSIDRPERVDDAYAFLHAAIRRVRSGGRVVVLGTPPPDCDEAAEAIAQRALEGLVRSLAKELRGGATGQLVYVARGAERQLESTLRFLLSARSAFVDGQVIRIGAPIGDAETVDWTSPLAGRAALVTGAARGIGAEIARVLARDGAHVVGLDVEPTQNELRRGMQELGGTALTVDITADEAPDEIAALLPTGRVDVVVHNAGITRDRSLARMSEREWRTVLAVNLTAPQRINEGLLRRDAIASGGRIVCVSSISGIAGNAGQANYATSKAGVIGLVETSAPALGKRGITINAVAPGFIETQMTAAMPVGLREAGRRLCSLRQGGLPVDVAETIAWLASPGSAGITGSVVRVCGQSLIGA
ncbi:MAG TPA: 3-oxoacyl-ACP reductase [Solirubrobacteraceae bacterium]|nr:3-oxoacyl-ACP reductase [Solirubrobacteraceae bacterium]